MSRTTKSIYRYLYLVIILFVVVSTMLLVSFTTKKNYSKNLFYKNIYSNIKHKWILGKDSPIVIEHRLLQLCETKKLTEALYYSNDKKKSCNDAKYIAMINYYQGVILYKMDSFRLALPCFQNCISSQNLTEQEVYASAYYYLGKVHKKLSDYSAALEYNRKSYRLNEVLGKESEKIKSLKHMGNIFARENKFDSARLYYSTCLDYYLKEKDSLNAAHIYNNFGNIAYQSSQYIEAIDNYIKSIKIKENRGDLKGLANSYNNLANIYNFALNNKNKAMLYYNKSLNLNKQLDKNINFAGIINNVGNIYSRKNEYDIAIFYFLEALEIYESENNQEGMGITYENLGITYIKKGNKEQATYYLRKSESVRQNINIGEQLGNVYNSLGSLYSDMSEYDSAIMEYEKALIISRNINDNNVIKNILQGLAEAYAAKEEFKKAYEFVLEYDTHYKSMLNENITSQVIRIQEEYETEKKQQRINQQNQEIKNKTNQRNKLFFVLSIILILFAIIIRLMLLKRRNDRKSYMKDIALKNSEIGELMQESEYKSLRAMVEGQDEERQKISRDLHDRVGNMLALLRLKMSSKISSQETANENIELLDSIYTQIRTVSHELGLSYISKFGLDSALQEMASTINSSGKIDLALNIMGETIRLKTDWEIEVFRIIQELVSNTLKHANAKNLDIQLHYSSLEKILSVSVEDDGNGFQPNLVDKGIGFSNIEYRIQKISGTFEINSTVGLGTCISITTAYPTPHKIAIKTNSYD